MNEITYIYGLKCPIRNEIRYVGKSNNPHQRIKSHIYDTLEAFKENKRTTYKERWIYKLHSKNLIPEVIILKEVLISEYMKWEEYYISYYKNKGNRMVNFDDKGIGNAGARNKLVKRLQNNKNLIRGVNKYDLNGNFIISYKSLREAERLTGINHGNISKNCNNIFKYTGGFIFKYSELENNEILSIIPTNIKKEVLKIDDDGNILEEYKSIAEAARINGIDAGNVSKVCNNKINKIRGYKFKFK